LQDHLTVSRLVLQLMMLRFNDKKILVHFSDPSIIEQKKVQPSSTLPIDIPIHDYLVSQLQYATKSSAPLEGFPLLAELLHIARPFLQGMRSVAGFDSP